MIRWSSSRTGKSSYRVFRPWPLPVINTVGHTIFMITSDGKSLAAIGDLTHHQILLVEKPRIEFAYDTDPKQSANTRVRVLATCWQHRKSR